MEAIHNFNLTSLLDALISLAAAFVLGGLIGFERQYRQRTAGLRTNVLVAVAAGRHPPRMLHRFTSLW
jgi:putative Mg2+ transporter-C (MgtC) family protein